MGDETLKEEVPVIAPLKAIDHVTITKAAGWWVAVVLSEVKEKKQIGIYLWQKKKDGKWHRKQKFTVHNPVKWKAIQEAVEKFIPQLKPISA